MTNVTLSDNLAYLLGGGIYNASNSISVIKNTLLWGNTAPSGMQIYNISSTAVISESVIQDGYVGGTNIITADPMLGTLGDYGGFTETIPLLAGSSAIDNGDDEICPSTDQRGVSRPQGTHCDIGAYEFDSASIDVTIGGGPMGSYECLSAPTRRTAMQAWMMDRHRSQARTASRSQPPCEPCGN
jgi:hypothetical protein